MSFCLPVCLWQRETEREYFNILPSTEFVSSDEIKYQNINSVYNSISHKSTNNALYYMIFSR